MRLALTYNIKKETENILSSAEEPSPKKDYRKYLNENLIQNYPERLDDTFAEWDCEETIEAVRSASAGGRTRCVTWSRRILNAYANLREINPEFVFNVAEGSEHIVERISNSFIA